jgi:hypothetical protein
MKYNTEFSIKLKPHGLVRPIITYGFKHLDEFNLLELQHDTTLDFNIDLQSGPIIFYIKFENKTNETPDMAVEIESVTFEGMTLDRFKWSNRYYPEYPEPWASEQSKPLPKFHRSSTYLGWNGQWELEFETPIFTWIHRLEHLGWIYS